MIVTKKITTTVNSYRPRIRQWLRPFDGDTEDVIQDIFVKILEADEGMDLHLIIYGTCSDYRRRQLNRKRLESENSDEICKNATPTLSVGSAGGPEDFVEGLQTLTRRWRTLSPLLRRIARLSYFGYTETPEKIARELGTTTAAVNTARTRIKQHMNGVNDVN